MAWVKNVAAFIAVNLFFIALALIAAGVMWALGTVTLRAWPDSADSVLAWLIIGFAGVAAAIMCAMKFLTFIGRQPRRG